MGDSIDASTFVRAALAAFVLDQDPASPQTFNRIFLSFFYLYTCIHARL